MRTTRSVLLAAIVILALSIAALPMLSAQEDEMVVCSSDLVLNLYIAERYFGFGTAREGTEMVDLATIDKGQFAPLFDAMMSDMSMDMDMATMEADMSMDMDMATMEATAEADMTMLMPTMITDEPAACTVLRTELTQFFTDVAYSDMSMGMDMSMDMATMEADMSMMTSFTAPLSGPQEVPGPGDADSTGEAVIMLNAATGEVCWDITVANATLPAAAAHIHVGELGVAGGVVVPLSAPDANGLASGCTTVETSVVEGILANPAGHYVNIHTSDFPDGALRGQLVGGM